MVEDPSCIGRGNLVTRRRAGGSTRWRGSPCAGARPAGRPGGAGVRAAGARASAAPAHRVAPCRRAGGAVRGLDSAPMDAIRVGALLDDKKFDLRLTLVAGKKGLTRRISSVAHPEARARARRLHRAPAPRAGPGLRQHRDELPRDAAARARASRCCGSFFAQDIACLVVTKGLPSPAGAGRRRRGGRRAAAADAAPLVARSSRACRPTSRTSSPPPTSMHGVLLDVFGVGILLLGKSGIGKSEIALDLVMRGHRLVADDIVDVKRQDAGLGLRRRLRDHQAPHGDPRARHHQHQGPVRRRLDPRAQEDRDRARARRVGPARRVRPARRRGEEVPASSTWRSRCSSCRCGRAAT